MEILSQENREPVCHHPSAFIADIWTFSSLFLLFVLIHVLILWRHVRQRYKRAYSLLRLCHRRLSDQSSALACARRDALLCLGEQETLRLRLSVSAGEQRRIEQRLSSYQDLLCRLFRRFMFRDGSVPLYGRDFSLLVEEYGRAAASGGLFVRHLRTLGIRLSDRDVFICILFHELDGKAGDLSGVLGCSSPSAFKSAKSKLKSRLRPLADSDAGVSALLEKFH